MYLFLECISELSIYTTSYFIAWSKAVLLFFCVFVYKKKNVSFFDIVPTWVALNAFRSDLILIIWNDNYCMGFLLTLIGLNQKWDIHWEKGGN